MYQKLLDCFSKNKAIILYLVFGALTTVVNYIVYFPLYNIAGFSATAANGVAWLASVLFAFLTNKPFVFKSNDWSAQKVFPEFFRFFGCRIVSGLMETAIIFIAADVLCQNGNLWKLIVSVFVVLLNYIGSKFFVFRSNN